MTSGPTPSPGSVNMCFFMSKGSFSSAADGNRFFLCIFDQITVDCVDVCVCRCFDDVLCGAAAVHDLTVDFKLDMRFCECIFTAADRIQLVVDKVQFHIDETLDRTVQCIDTAVADSRV